MKIGIDARLWNESGVGRYVRNLVFELVRIDKKNTYVLFVRKEDESRIKNYELGENWKIIIADVHWHTLAEQILLPAIISKENLDLVHFPYFSVPLLYNRPFVVTIHDLILHHFPTGEASTLPLPFYSLKLFGYRYIIAKAAKAAKKIITVSYATEQEIIDHLDIPKEKISVTYEGVEISNLKSQNSKLQLKTQSYLLYIGNAYPHKNLNRLIEVFTEVSDKILRSAKNDIKLVLVGKEDYFYKKLQQKVTQLNVKEMVLFAGEVSDQELAKLYKNARAYITPSLMEGFALPILEAMANKCLVLASDIPAHKEVAEDAAFYFNPQSVEDIAKAIETICSSNLNHWSKNIAQGVKRARIFSWEKMAKETLKVYESCISL